MRPHPALPSAVRSLLAAALLAGCGGTEPAADGPDERLLEGPFTGLRVDGGPDLTGDGLPDLVVGAPGLDGAGDAWVFSGLPSGDLAPADAAAVVSGDAPGDLGEGLAACGDVNGDGAADLLLGGPHADDERGGAWLFAGPLSGELGTGDARFLPGVEAEALAGFTVACDGDTDGDGLYDLAISAPAADGFGTATGVGLVSFLRGTSDAPDLVGSLSSTWSDSRLGAERSLLLRDLDGDGLDDAVVGAPGTARVHLLYGPLQGTYDPNVSGVTLTSDDDRDGAGSALAAGDTDGDGYDELFVGAPGFDRDRGRISVVGGPIGRDETAQLAVRGRWIEGQDPGERAGYALAMGDVDGDGLEDLIVGAPGAVTVGPAGGVAYLLYGPVDHGTLADADAVLVGGVSLGELGTSVAAVPDLDGDGGAEILVGAPYTDVDGRIGSGAAYLFVGAPVGQVESDAASARFVF